MTEKLILDFIAEICEELEIEIPEISHDTSKFKSKTMMAMCDGNTIYFKKTDKPNPDVLFSIAHELRHLWQIKTDEKYYFENYKEVGTISTEDYNKQIAEVDANAYAGVVMIDCFNLQPLFQGMAEDVVKLIRKRMKEIY